MRGHRWHQHRRRRIGPLGQYVRARLHRRLFVWFAASIVVTALAVTAAFALVGRVEPPWWRKDYDRGREFIGRQFANNWAEPQRNAEFIKDLSQSFDVDVQVVGADGQVLQQSGNACAHPGFVAPIERDGQRLGTVRLCFERRATGMGWKPLVGLLVAIGVLWAASGKVARRLARPLDELSDVVRRIGEGELGARSELACHAPGEIGVVAEAVNEMAARIQKQLADQRELLATVSHELRTPLARMRLINELGRDNGATPKTWDDLDREVVEMDSLVGQLLASSRVDFGALALRELSIRDTALAAVERAGLPPEVLEVTTAHQQLKGDPTLLSRALANLLDNSRKHAGGVEKFLVHDEGATVVFELQDKGPGFTDVADSPTRGDGLGLGLKLVRRIAQAHGGTAFAENRPGGGARVGFKLPVG